MICPYKNGISGHMSVSGHMITTVMSQCNLMGQIAPHLIVAHLHDRLYPYLVGGWEDFLFFHVLGIMNDPNWLIFFRGVGIPPTKYYILFT